MAGNIPIIDWWGNGEWLERGTELLCPSVRYKNPFVTRRPGRSIDRGVLPAILARVRWRTKIGMLKIIERSDRKNLDWLGHPAIVCSSLFHAHYLLLLVSPFTIANVTFVVQSWSCVSPPPCIQESTRDLSFWLFTEVAAFKNHFMSSNRWSLCQRRLIRKSDFFDDLWFFHWSSYHNSWATHLLFHALAVAMFLSSKDNCSSSRTTAPALAKQSCFQASPLRTLHRCSCSSPPSWFECFAFMCAVYSPARWPCAHA